jgi:hypothetical protein
MTAENGAALQLGVRFEGEVQRDQILPDQRLGAIILVPIRPKCEKLPDGDDKKAKLAVTLSTLHTPSSYLTEAHASRGRARFFSALNELRTHSPHQRPTPYHPPDQLASPAARRPHPRDLQGLLGRRKPFLLSK